MPSRVWTAAVAVGLSLGGMVYAVASWVPEPPQWSRSNVREVAEWVQASGLSEIASDKTDEPASEPRFYRTELMRSGDSIDALLRRMGVNDAEAAQYLRSDAAVRQNLMGRTGRWIRTETDAQQRLLSFQARWSVDEPGQFKRLSLVRENPGSAAVAVWSQRIEQAPLKVGLRYGGGEIQSSLFAASDAAHIPDAVAVQMAEIFSGEIDFYRSLRKGDRFSVVYEVLEADGEALQTGRVLSSEFVNQGKAYSALWFAEPKQKGQYYSFDGKSLNRAYLASPLAFSRITSGFKMRLHPLLHKWVAHQGVDYAAPVGTPVRVVGNGVVAFAGWQNGFGNVVVVNHRNSHSTVYAHLSRIGVRVGQAVAQSDTLGAVGATGWATGPHLHFEFRVAGVHKDPRLIARQENTEALSASAMPLFAALARQQRLQLDAAAAWGGATVE